MAEKRNHGPSNNLTGSLDDFALRRSERLKRTPVKIVQAPRTTTIFSTASTRLSQTGEKSVFGAENVQFNGNAVRDRKNDSITSSQRTQRERIEAESRAAAEIEKIEFYLLQKEVELKKNEVNRNLALELSKIDDRSQASRSILGEEISIQDAEERVENWINSSKIAMAEKEKSPEVSSVEKLITVMTQTLQQGQKGNDMRRFMARQSSFRELIPFSGAPEEWPGFITDFEESTAQCEFSDAENMARLRKCLKGKAREAVHSMLLIPENLRHVLEVLEISFGRSDQIIYSLIEKAKSIASPKENSPEMIIDFFNAVNNMVNTMKTLRKNAHLMNPQLIRELVNKLPMHYKIKWGKYMLKCGNEVTLNDFADWLRKCAQVASLVGPTNVPTYDHSNWKQTTVANKTGFKKPTVLLTNTIDKESCKFCDKSSHTIEECDKFKNLSSDERWSWITKEKRCFRCLTKGHRKFTCKSKKVCGIDGCKSKHNALLHASVKAVTDEIETVNHTIGMHNSVLLRILPVTLKGPKAEVKTFALLDDASTVTLLDNDVAAMIGVTGEKEPLSMCWINGVPSQPQHSERVSLTVSNEDEEFELKNVRTVKNLNLPTQSVDVKKLSKRWEYLRDKCSLENAKPTILIGQDNCHLILAREIVEGPKNAPVLTRTKLGWIIHGNVGQFKDRTDSEIICHTWTENTHYDELSDLVKSSFSTDNFGVIPAVSLPRSNEDIRAEHIFNTTTKKSVDEPRWETGLLWKTDKIQMPPSKPMAFKRLQGMEKKMDSNSEFALKYCEQITNYLKADYIKKLTKKENNDEDPHSWYLPHFGVINPNKPGKFRLVFDAAAKSNGVCLNDVLLKGPDLLCPLVSVLLKFRQKKIAFCADIKEMFHRVKIIPSDWVAQKFLFRGMDRHRPPDVYVMKVMTFGATCSPSSAQFVKNHNALQFEDQYPDAVIGITKKHYVDDYLDGADTVKEAIKLINDVISVNISGGFELRNWISNNAAVIEKIPENLRSSTLSNFEIGEELPTERILGLYWNANTDEFQFNCSFHKIEKGLLDGVLRPTKRQYLKILMSLFDPLGFLAHFTVRGKILLQEIWRSKIGWDDEVPLSIYTKWSHWIQELKKIPKFKVPRCYMKIVQNYSVQMHVFCDASEKAFAAVVYLRMNTEDDVELSFVMAKTRVAPLKPLSIPRMELQAALLGSRLYTTVVKELEYKIPNVTFWSDSKTLLYWLRSETKIYKPFVAHRVGEITESTNFRDWRWVPTSMNVADLATRDHIETDLSSKCAWINGPEFLLKSEEHWPTEDGDDRKDDEVNAAEIEEKTVQLVFLTNTISEELIEAKRFSSWMRLKRAVAWVLRFVQNCKLAAGSRKGESELLPHELMSAELVLLKQSQNQSFPEEIKCLKKNDLLTKRSRIFKLTPKLDEDGILRVDGRTTRSPELSLTTKNPAILDSKHYITILIIRNQHKLAMHNGQELVMNELRQQYYVLNARTAVRRVWKDCPTCILSRAKPTPPQMAPLPLCRVTQQKRAFMETGLDYFGPMEVTIGRRREKRYGVLFTCMATRAIHLEIAASLTTDSAIMAIRRFSARRGFPNKIFSDNGTNFRGADKELANALKEFDQGQITADLSNKGVEWHFNPPSAPHMGGSWERMVKSVKTTLLVVLREQAPREEILQTLFAEVENIVNSHPLTHVSTDHNDMESLTPNHFLLGMSGNMPIPGMFDDSDLILRKQWRKSQRFADQFWKRWVREYLPVLTRRTKWHQQTKPIQIGNLVLVADGNLPRNCWPRGIVTSVFPGTDGIVRTVEVRTATHGKLKRPVVKICALT